MRERQRPQEQDTRTYQQVGLSRECMYEQLKRLQGGKRAHGRLTTSCEGSCGERLPFGCVYPCPERRDSWRVGCPYRVCLRWPDK